MVSDTLFLAVSYVDRYLSQQQVPRSRLQLVGVSCMLIAAKYEEIYAPQVAPHLCPCSWHLYCTSVWRAAKCPRLL